MEDPHRELASADPAGKVSYRPSGVRMWLAVGRTDIRRGMNEWMLHAKRVTKPGPHAGDLYCVFRDASPLPVDRVGISACQLVRMFDHAC